jgi:hypothetical protein
MKFRLGFISNSSTCCFICNVCQDIAAGYDVNFKDYELWQCKNGHLFHEGCTSNFEEKRKIAVLKAIEEADQEKFKDYFCIKNEDELKEVLDIEGDEDIDSLEEFLEEWYEWRYEAHPSMCPICCFEHLTDDDEVLYYRKKYNIDPKKTLQGIRDNFKSYGEFCDFILNKQPKLGSDSQEPITCCKKQNDSSD